MDLYLQKIVQQFDWHSLRDLWLDFNFSRFTDIKTLFDYQQQALKNTAKALHKYYVDCGGDKQQFFQLFLDNGLEEKIDLDLYRNKNLQKIFEQFDKDFRIQDNKIAGYNFINRMSFWMATGSGKTLIIVKIIELLYYLMKHGLIPQKDILFLTYRDDLLQQFKTHLDEFTKANHFLLNFYSLKDYENKKRDTRLSFDNELTVFYYRSDLIGDRHKDKIIDFKNYDNNGNWYIILDEAHKGDKEDSKRQQFYSILSRNGFMFNFSATFTNVIDFVTCVYNFNLEQFIQNGYGKQIYISHNNLDNLSLTDNLNIQAKQRVILKILLLLTYINQQKNLIGPNFYHKPLLLTLVNSVNTEDSDLLLFFKELEKIAYAQNDDNILSAAKAELYKELNNYCEFTNEKIKIDYEQIEKYTYQDILENVFHASKSGKIEVLKIPGNKQEILLKLTTSDRPFGLIKIGDISEWIKNKLSGYEIIEKFENQSIFKQINKNDSDITILMGSRSFYEGWDSNRPNIILYINIGKGTDARKFVLQSLGRGVRIEPIPGKRKRLISLRNNNEIAPGDFREIQNYAPALETLFIYGTKAENIKEVIETLKHEKQEELIGDLFEINPDIQDKTLFIPVYTETETILMNEEHPIKFAIHPEDYELLKKLFAYLSDRVLLVKYNCDPKVLKKLRNILETKYLDYFTLSDRATKIQNPEVLLHKISRHFTTKVKEFSTFKVIENEILHFKRITVSKDKCADLRDKIIKVKKSRYHDQYKSEITQKFLANEITIDDFVRQIQDIATNLSSNVEVFYSIHDKLIIKYLANHYYIPIALADSEKIDFIKHIIKNESERKFIYDLEQHLAKEENFFSQFEWWYFSKVDETLDEIYIPYYQDKTNKIEKFKPDFIFWLKKENNYTILFIDPKGTEHTDSFRKIDGYTKVFQSANTNSAIRQFSHDGLNIQVRLLLKTDSKSKIPDPYKDYWFDNFDELKQKIIV